MSLTPTARLGPYEIIAPLGAGGMGEVYRARDPRLKRDIAIKVLPDDVASSPERLARFEREATTVEDHAGPRRARGEARLQGARRGLRGTGAQGM